MSIKNVFFKSDMYTTYFKRFILKLCIMNISLLLKDILYFIGKSYLLLFYDHVGLHFIFQFAI